MNNQNSKSKGMTITWNKEKQMTGQHEPPWKPEVKSGAPEGLAFPAPHDVPYVVSMNETYYDNNIMA